MARFDLSDLEWDRALVAEQAAGRSAGRRPPRGERHLLGVADGLAVARLAGPVRALPDGVQPLQPVGQAGGVVACFRDPVCEIAGFASSDRLLDRARPSARGRRKKGGPDHAIGRSRGGLSTKIHAVVDAHGLPVRFVLTPGQASDKTTLPALIDGLRLARDVVADRGYDARAIVELIEARGATAHIPTQSNVVLWTRERWRRGSLWRACARDSSERIDRVQGRVER